MKKLMIGIALLVGALATLGQVRHPSNPLTVGGNKMQTTVAEWPQTYCPPNCGDRFPNSK